MTGNPLIYVSTLAIILIVAVIIIFNFRGEPDISVPTPAVSPPAQLRAADEDTESEAVVAVGSQIKGLEAQQKENNATLNQRIDELTQIIKKIQTDEENNTVAPVASTEITPSVPGDDLGTLMPELIVDQFKQPEISAEPPPQWIWIEDQSGVQDNLDETNFIEAVENTLNANIVEEQGGAILNAVTSAEKQEDVEPRHVIPPATIIEGITLTAALGRIPIRGKVDDAWPVKIISTPKGYAPNGYEINAGAMIWEGSAYGDANFECVRVMLYRVASVLPGRIMSFIETQDKEKGLGYITDEQGNPCLRGKLISNAAKHLTANAVLGTVRGLGRAYADAERTRTTSAEGNVIESVTGDELRVLLGEAVSGAAEGINSYLSDRSDIWDAIYVPPERTVIINVEQPLDFQYDKNQKLFDFARFTMRADHTQSTELD